MQFLMLHNFDETYLGPNLKRLNPLIKAESMRRLAWSVYFLDTLADTGRHGAHMVTESHFRIQLPCDETSFMRGLDVKTASLSDTESSGTHISSLSPHSEGPAHVGISANLIRTAAMRRRILHYNSLIKYSCQTPAQILDDLNAFERELKLVVADISEDLAYTEQNLFIHIQRLPAFIFLHLLRHNCFLMLSLARLTVCSLPYESGDLLNATLQDRIRHALPVSRIIADALRLGVNCDPAASVQAYTSLEGECGPVTLLERSADSQSASVRPRAAPQV